MKRLALVGFPDGLARQDIAPTLNGKFLGKAQEVISYYQLKHH